MFDVISFIKIFGYLGVSTLVFAESGLFFGFFFPGDSLLFTAGFLSSQGFLNIIPLIFCTGIAAILGDSVGYWFGRKVGPMIFHRQDSRWFSQKRVGEAHEFFKKYGPKSLILARFIPAVRTFTPILAGVGVMPYRKFFVYNCIGGILWGVGMPLLGYFLGATIPGIDRYIFPIILLIVVVSALPVVIPIIRSQKSDE